MGRMKAISVAMSVSDNGKPRLTAKPYPTYTTQTTSNRLTGLSGARVKSFGYDAAGNLTTDGATATYGYDNAGRRTTATINGQSWQYAYNGLGQRVRKTGPAGTTLYAYDEAGHLTGEYDGTGQLIQETVWLGDEPVATLRHPAGTTSGPATPYYVHADHLGTPRRVTRPMRQQSHVAVGVGALRQYAAGAESAGAGELRL